MNHPLIFHHYFPPAVNDYLSGKDKLRQFYTHSPDLTGLKKAAEARAESSFKNKILTQVIREQYNTIGAAGKTVFESLDALEKGEALTITTGHQICLLTGPLYVIFKIASTIKLARILQAEYPQKKIIPVYWAATEDHDFEEIRSIFLNGKKYTWNPPLPVSGAVGRINTSGMEEFFRELEFGENNPLTINHIYRVFKKAWTEQATLSDAMRKAIHELFGKYGLICLDPDDARLKKAAARLFENELFERPSYPLIKNTSESLHKLGYKTPVEPREINLFYLKDGIRERIVINQNRWEVLNSEIRFSADELKAEWENHPERFSPNVALRPVFQEMLLPNIAYIGGAAEIGYWLQLKSVFNAFATPFPALIPRDGFLPIPKSVYQTFRRYGFSDEDLMAKPDTLLKRYVSEKMGTTLSVEKEAEAIDTLFRQLKERFAFTGPQAEKTFGASEKKLQLELNRVKAKALKLAGKKEESLQLFLQKTNGLVQPEGMPAERKYNFLEFTGIWGDDPVKSLIESCEPLNPGMKILTY
jgi:bacillithiol biosynthesis cysteine-adding enzyme BshC